MKVRVICKFYGIEEQKNFDIGDIIEVTTERQKKLKRLGLIAEDRETKVIEPEERKRGRPRKEV